LLFLWIAGTALEERWGMPLFIFLYFTGGISAAFIQEAVSSVRGFGVVGASGAVAALMGAFLIRHYKMPIRMFYFIFLIYRIRTGTFSAPAWLMLGLWLLQVVFSILLTIGVKSQGGVAHWAHMGGFIFGLGAAALIAKTKIASRWEKEAENTSGGIDVNLEEANKLFNQGQIEESKKIFERILQQNPKHLGVLQGILHVYDYLEEKGKIPSLRLQAISSAQQSGKFDLANKMLLDHQAEFNLQIFSDNHLILYAQILTNNQQYEEAVKTYANLIDTRKASPHRGKAIFQAAKLLKTQLNKPALALKWFEVLKSQPYDLEWAHVVEPEIQSIRGL